MSVPYKSAKLTRRVLEKSPGKMTGVSGLWIKDLGAEGKRDNTLRLGETVFREHKPNDFIASLLEHNS